MNEIFPIELTIGGKSVSVQTVEELRRKLDDSFWCQAYSRMGVTAIGKHKTNISTKFQNRYIKYKLTDQIRDRQGNLAEKPQDYINRHKPKEQIEKKINYIIECCKAQLHPIILPENIFANRTAKFFDNVKSIFTYEEIKHIFQKISTPHIRYLCKEFNSNLTELHKIAMAYYNHYGGHLLTFLLKLPPVRFADERCFQIRDYHNRGYLIPTITLQNLTARNEMRIYFYPAIERNNRFCVASIQNSSGTEIGEITVDGKIVPKNTEVRPSLSLFARNIPGNISLFSGAEIGTKCLYCNLPLEDPLSIKWGYGKTCADNYGLPYW